MRIDTTHIVQRLSGIRPKNLGGVNDAPEAADSADFSRRAADIQTAMDALKDAPEVREDTIADLQARLQDGTFDVSGDDLAKKLLG